MEWSHDDSKDDNRDKGHKKSKVMGVVGWGEGTTFPGDTQPLKVIMWGVVLLTWGSNLHFCSVHKKLSKLKMVGTGGLGVGPYH